MSDLETILISTIIVTIVLLIAIWYSPRFLRIIAALLDSRAIALAFYKLKFEETIHEERIRRGV